MYALAVVYPQRTAGACALARRPAPDLAGLCRTLSWNGFNYLLVEEDEPTRLPHVLDWQGTNLVDRATGARLVGAEAVLDWAERRLGRRRTPGRIVRDYLDGSRVTVDVAACSVTVETKGGHAADATASASARRDVSPDAAANWRLKLDGPSRRRVWFWTSEVGPVVNRPWESGPKAKAANRRRDQPDNSAKVTLEAGLKGVRFVLRTAGKDRLSVTLDGRPLDFSEPATSLVYSFNEICRETKPMDLAAGEHVLVLSGGRDGKMFFPALWMVGAFAERAPGHLSPTPTSVGLGSLAAAGLGEVVSKAGLRQLRLAETQKIKHVTSFFNGKSTTPSAGEDQVEVKSRFDAATFASHPEMEAYNVTDELLKRLENNPYGFIVVNYANCDMVGHTGDEKAATRAVEVTDECIGKVLPRLLELDAHVLIFADHGNAEQMVDYKTGLTKTSHTLNLVDCFYVANDAAGVRLTPLAKLSAVAPTALQMLGIPVPPEMTTPSLLAGKENWSKTALNV